MFMEVHQTLIMQRNFVSFIDMKKKTIKWNKGLFRVWIVLTIIWFIICTLRVLDGVKRIHGFTDLELFGVFVVPPILLAIIFFICPPVLKWVKAGFK